MPQKYYKWLVWGSLAVFIKLFSLNSQWVTDYYTHGVYPYIAAVLRWLLGWLPFSLGDIGYGMAVLWLLVQVVKLIRRGWQRLLTASMLWRGIRRMVFILLVVYVLFNLLWGLNYNQRGIASQLQLRMVPYTAQDLAEMNALLLDKVNACKQSLVQRNYQYPTNKELFAKVKEAYKAAAGEWPFLTYRPASLKPSLWGWLGNYTGFTGYYNPFSAEAQVNTTVPRFLQPYTSCHEVGHQLGYAKENEANFAGYLSASASPDTAFKYSVYLDLFLYANGNLRGIDTAAANGLARRLDTTVKKDLAEWRAFNRAHRNPFAPVVRWFYSWYLRSNGQPQGLLSYDAVTAFMIAYYKKFGKL